MACGENEMWHKHGALIRCNLELLVEYGECNRGRGKVMYFVSWELGVPKLALIDRSEEFINHWALLGRKCNGKGIMWLPENCHPYGAFYHLHHQL